jgi:hypothetical protein
MNHLAVFNNKTIRRKFHNIENSELASQRARAIYKAKGHPED